MSSSRRPWYPWYPKDFTSDEKVQCLPPLAELIYRRALDLMWQSNDIRIPNAMPLLWQSLGKGIAESDFAMLWERIMYPEFALFDVSEDEKWVFSRRLRRESRKIKEMCDKKQAAGIIGAKARWNKDTKAKPKQTHGKRMANAWQTDSHTEPYTDTEKEITPHSPPKGGSVQYSKSFDEWWLLYPKKVGKDAALRSWKKVTRANGVTVEKLMAAIKEQIKAGHFKGNDGCDYIPNPATWLNQGRWNDEIKTCTKKEWIA